MGLSIGGGDVTKGLLGVVGDGSVSLLGGSSVTCALLGAIWYRSVKAICGSWCTGAGAVASASSRSYLRHRAALFNLRFLGVHLIALKAECYWSPWVAGDSLGGWSYGSRNSRLCG